MAEGREFQYYSNDLNGDGIVNGNGLNAPVIGEFPLDVGEPATVFLRAMVYEGSDGAGGGIFRDAVDDSEIYVSDVTRLEPGSPLPTPVDEPLPLDPGEPDVPVATDGDDVLIGTPEDDTILGLGGDDVIAGESGNDLLIGDLEQFLDEGAVGGNDVIQGGDGDDAIFGDTAGNLSAVMLGGNDILFGNAGNDTLTGDADVLGESAIGGNDVLIAGEPIDDAPSVMIGDGTIRDLAEGGDDVLVGSNGAETMYGDGVDMHGFGVGGNDRITGGGGNDIIYGDGETMTRNVTGGDDRIQGGTGDDVLFGDAEARSGDTALMGSDTFIFATGDGVDEIGDFETDKDTIDVAGVADIDGFDDLVANHLTESKEGQAVIDTDDSAKGNNTIALTGYTVDDFSDGTITAGNFIFAEQLPVPPPPSEASEAQSLPDAIAVAQAEPDEDTDVSALQDLPEIGGEIVVGTDGNDIIGENLASTGVRPQSGTTNDGDVVAGYAGTDFIFGANGDDVIDGGDGDDWISGGEGNDVITGGSGDDNIVGGDDDDLLFGEDGNDIIEGNGGNDIILAGSGNDVVAGGLLDDLIYGMDGNDNLEGNNGDDILSGGDDRDILYGGDGQDDLSGDAGDDFLEGGGNDRAGDELTGGDGNDIFFFFGANGNDVITDFIQGEDLIDLSNYPPEIDDIEDLVIEQDGDNAVISGYSDEIGNSITVENIDAVVLSNDDFNFV